MVELHHTEWKGTWVCRTTPNGIEFNTKKLPWYKILYYIIKHYGYLYWMRLKSWIGNIG